MLFVSAINTLLDLAMLLTFACLILPGEVLFSFNPLIVWMLTLVDRIHGFLRTALPLPRRGILLILFLLLLSVKATLLYRQSATLSGLVIGNAILFKLPSTQSFPRWFAIALTHFTFFWATFSLTVALLRPWNRNGTFPYPGRVGDALLFLSRPFSARSLTLSLPTLLILLVGAALIAFPQAESISFVNYFQVAATRQITESKLTWDPASAAFTPTCLTIALTALTAIPTLLQQLMLVFIIFNFAALLARQNGWMAITQEGIASLMGRSAGSPALILGGFNLGPIAFIFVMGIFISAINFAAGFLYTFLTKAGA